MIQDLTNLILCLLAPFVYFILLFPFSRVQIEVGFVKLFTVVIVLFFVSLLNPEASIFLTTILFCGCVLDSIRSRELFLVFLSKFSYYFYYSFALCLLVYSFYGTDPQGLGHAIAVSLWPSVDNSISTIFVNKYIETSQFWGVPIFGVVPLTDRMNPTNSLLISLFKIIPHSNFLDYLQISIQALWVIPAMSFLEARKLPRKLLLLAMLNPVLIFYTIYTWFKVLAAAFFLTGVNLYSRDKKIALISFFTSMIVHLSNAFLLPALWATRYSFRLKDILLPIIFFSFIILANIRYPGTGQLLRWHLFGEPDSNATLLNLFQLKILSFDWLYNKINNIHNSLFPLNIVNSLLSSRDAHNGLFLRYLYLYSIFLSLIIYVPFLTLKYLSNEKRLFQLVILGYLSCLIIEYGGSKSELILHHSPFSLYLLLNMLLITAVKPDYVIPLSIVLLFQSYLFKPLANVDYFNFEINFFALISGFLAIIGGKKFMKNYKMVQSSNLLLCLLSFVLVISLSLFVFTALKIYHHHESAYTLLYAENILAHGLYSETFGGREASYLTWAVVSSLVLKLFGFTLQAHSVTSFLFIIFYALTIYVFAKYTRIGVKGFCVLTILSFSLYSDNITSYQWFDQVFVWPMNSYGFYDLLSVLLLLCFVYVIDFYRKFSTSKVKFGLVLFFVSIFTVACSTTNTRGALVILLPVFSAIIYYSYTIEFAKSRSPIIGISLYFIALSAAALIISKASTSHAVNLIQSSHLSFGDTPVVSGIIGFIDKWYSLFSAQPTSKIAMLSAQGVVYFARLFVATFALLLPFWAILNLKSYPTLHQTFLIKHSIIFALVFIAFVFGVSHQERYFIPVAISSFFVLSIVNNRIAFILKLIFYSSIFVVATNSVFWYINSAKQYEENKAALLESVPSYRLAKFLQKNNLKFGYESKWYRQTLPVNLYSNGTVRLALLDLEFDLRPHFHSSSDWLPPKDADNIFLIVDSQDIDKSPAVKYLLEKYNPTVLAYEDRLVLIFKSDAQIANLSTEECSANRYYIFNSEISDFYDPYAFNVKGFSCAALDSLKLDYHGLYRELKTMSAIYVKPSSHSYTVLLKVAASKDNDCFSVYRGNTHIVDKKLDSTPSIISFNDHHDLGEIVEYRVLSCSRAVKLYQIKTDR